MAGSILKRIFPNSFKKKLRDNLGVPSQELSLKRIKHKGFDPKTCLDIGAYEGNWTVEFKHIFPNSAVLMLEGQTEKEPFLISTKKKFNNVDYKIALMGANDEATVTFNKYATASSVLAEHNITGAKTETRKLIALDTLVASTDFARPSFIKIDTQGYELEILKGGKKTLASAEFVLLEVSFLDIYINCPLAADVVSFMDEQGFVIYDICTLMKRPLDGALFQSDFLFIAKESRFRKDKRWS